MIQYLDSPEPIQLNALFRQRLFKGELIQASATTASLSLAQRAYELLKSVLGTAYPDSLHEIWSPTRLHQAISHVRREVTQDQLLHEAYAQLLKELGLDFSQWRIDQPRLRAVIPGAERLIAAAPMYYAHRDTWYANPAAQINLWLPLADYLANQTFVFWPSVFAELVKNDSEALNYTDWKQKIGFQNPSPRDGVYPRALELPKSIPTEFACRRGELLFFSGSQLHQTRPNSGPAIRYSLDLRLVCLDDLITSKGAPDPDNHSQGSTLDDYVYLGALSDANHVKKP